jgi:hypothetical protein
VQPKIGQSLKTERVSNYAKEAEPRHPVFDEPVNLDLTIFRGIGQNHQRSFERNQLSRSHTFTGAGFDSRSQDRGAPLISVNEDWKNFTLNNRKHIDAANDTFDSKARANKEKESTLDSADLARFRDSLPSYHNQTVLREVPAYIKDDSNVTMLTLEL